MKKISFKGPFKLIGEPLVFEYTNQVNGVYLWCVKTDDGIFRVYYVGEAENIGTRLKTHLKNHINGRYSGHCIESLKNNIKILMHRADEGMIPKFSDIDPHKFNIELIKELWIFFAELPVSNDHAANKWIRCRYETGIARQVEDGGQNILSVGHLRYWNGEKHEVLIETGSMNIEYISNQIIHV